VRRVISTTSDQLPRAIEHERLALGSIIAFPECAPDVFAKLHARDFTNPALRAIYAAMRDQHARGLRIDPPLLGTELRSHPEFADGSAVGFMLELAQSVATVAHVGIYAEPTRQAASLCRRDDPSLCQRGKFAEMSS
jgi:replicative DNA helicase